MDKNKRGSKKITILDIAKRLGISPATVSNALTGERYVKKETIEKVKKLAGDLDYRPNIIARALRSKKRSIIGLITSNIRNPFYAEVISGVEDILSKRDYILVINSTSFNKDTEVKSVKQFGNLLVDGFIFVGGLSDFTHIDQLLPIDTPVVLINRKIIRSKYTEITIDYKKAMTKMVDYLSDKGHKAIGYVGWKNNYAIIPMEKYSGYVDGLKKNSLPENKNIIFTKDTIPIREFREYREYVGEIYPVVLKEKVTALIAQTDSIALGLMDGFRELKIKIPDDLSISGCGNINQSRTFYPPLTTIHIPKIRMGRFAAEVLLDLISKGRSKKQTIYLKSTIIKRASIADIPY
jgi:LacI family transcriptional regulator